MVLGAQDVITSGGIWELRKIAAQAETRNISIAPHCPYGPVSLVASLHLDTVTPNFLIQGEHSLQTAVLAGLLSR